MDWKGEQMERIFTVMSYNMKRNMFDLGKHAWKRREDDAVDLIRLNQPDILGTQELVSKSLRCVAGRLEEYGWCGAGRNGGDKGEYTAIFYRKDKFNLVDSDTFWLSNFPKVPGSRAWFAAFPRICTWCILEFKEEPGLKVKVYNTHLDHLSFYARINSAKLIKQHMLKTNQLESIPVIFMGDFNAHPTSRTLRFLESMPDGREDEIYLINSYHHSAHVRATIGPSYHGYSESPSGAPIDYIFTSADLKVQDVEIERTKFSDFHPSDHFPVVAKIKV